MGIKKTTPEHRFPWFSAISPEHEKEKKTGCAQVAGKKFPKHEVKNSARPADLLVRNPKKEIPKHSTDEGECPSHELRTTGISIFFTTSTTSSDTKYICGENICGENRDGYIQKGLEIT